MILNKNYLNINKASQFFTFILLLVFTPLTEAAAVTNGQFPFGVFDKSDPYDKFDKKPYLVGSNEWLTYRKEFVKILLKYNINTVINTPYKNDKHARTVLDHLHKNQINVIFQPGNPFNRKNDIATPGYAENSIYRHPSIIAYKLWDEPKTQKKLDKLKIWYSLIENHYDKPIITAMIGELMGESKTGKQLKIKGGDNDISLTAWQRLDSEILFARHYPLRRTYDLINWYDDKMKMPFHEWCAYMETAYKDKPWWYIPPLFGKGKEKSHKSYWRFPTSNEINVLIHTALANGARGIIGWGIPTYDYSRKKTRKMFIDESLQLETARDGSIPMEQYGRIGELTKTHASLLLRHKRSNIQLIESNDNVLKVPRVDPETSDLYVYTVNLNTVESKQTSFIISKNKNITTAVDIYSNKKLNVAITEDGTKVSYLLSPGEALFVQLK
ncbi:MAG: hypothetical protein COA54_01220 [Thiotrichaceae bacterium]|nr:MAG: hypothetical protein COA54_01220 [Thiotrichaceae bacterium]